MGSIRQRNDIHARCSYRRTTSAEPFSSRSAERTPFQTINVGYGGHRTPPGERPCVRGRPKTPACRPIPGIARASHTREALGRLTDERRPRSIGVRRQAIDDAYGSGHDAESWWQPHGVGPPDHPARLRRLASSRPRRHTATAAVASHSSVSVGPRRSDLSGYCGRYGRQELLLLAHSDYQSTSFPLPAIMILPLLAVSSQAWRISLQVTLRSGTALESRRILNRFLSGYME